jgi:hypothetical protein
VRYIPIILALAVLASTLASAQGDRTTHPDLQGIWNGSTMTPLQRPDGFKDKRAFTPEEAADWAKHASDRIASRLPSDLDRFFSRTSMTRMWNLRRCRSMVCGPR